MVGKKVTERFGGQSAEGFESNSIWDLSCRKQTRWKFLRMNMQWRWGWWVEEGRSADEWPVGSCSGRKALTWNSCLPLPRNEHLCIGRGNVLELFGDSKEGCTHTWTAMFVSTHVFLCKPSGVKEAITWQGLPAPGTFSGLHGTS